MENVILEVKNLSKTYSGITVLNEVSFDLRAGEVHALVGENGAGKSTMIKIIAGVEKPDEGGEIYINGSRATRLTAAKSIQMGVTVIYQDISLFPNLTVAENISIEKNKSMIVNRSEMKRIAQEALDTMGVKLDLDAKLGDISIGKQQLVAIARAITFKSKVIVMDEPTAALSSAEVDMLYNIIRAVKAQGIGIIYISHKLDEIFTVADRISILRDGKMVACDDASAFDNQKLINLMVGRELRFIPMRNEEEASDETIFEVRNMTCEPFFRNVSFQLKKHEILGLTGLVGAGRSELAHAIFGLMKPHSGEIFIHGEKVVVKSPEDAILKGIGYLPEDRRKQGLFHGHSMTCNISAVTLSKHLNRIKLISRKKELKTASDYINKLSIRPNLPSINVENMSGGNQQKALFSRWLETGPKVLIVDEPTCGIDVGAKLEIHKLLRQLAKNGVAVILISSDLPEILAISDRILVMCKGTVVDETVAGEATQEGVLEKGLMGSGREIG
ncbi:MAG TPA: sugar ABC transporter ATP-binding protein [Ruminiclostridium sp.]|nr:sugar ABC transporter ATP-binding protein [Ruminiclostridium sp.]